MDLQQYITYDPAATVANVIVETGLQETKVTVNTANAAPVPKILLGQNADYSQQAVPPIAQVEVPPTPSEPGQVPTPPTETLPTPSPATETLPTSSPATGTQTPTIFNVEPLNGGQNDTASSEVTLINPAKEGEQVATTKPEFRGTGPGDTVLAITVNSTKPYSGSTVVENDGTWSWSPPADLAPGEHTVTIAYIDEAGDEQKLTRKFFVSAALAADGTPSFESTPSASVKASPKSSVKASPSPKPSGSPVAETDDEITGSVRETMPSTDSGVPVTGLISPSLLTAALGFVIMVLGALLLAI